MYMYVLDDRVCSSTRQIPGLKSLPRSYTCQMKTILRAGSRKLHYHCTYLYVNQNENYALKSGRLIRIEEFSIAHLAISRKPGKNPKTI